MKKGYLRSSMRTVSTLLLVTFLVCGMLDMAAHGAEKPEIFVQLGHQGDVRTAAFSPEGTYAVTGGEDLTVKLWDAASGTEVRTFAGHAAEIGAVAVSSGGELVVSGDAKGTIKLWDARTGRAIRTISITGNHPSVRFLSFSPDARSITSVAMDGVLTVWDVSTGRPVKSVARIKAYSYMPPGETFAAAETDHRTYALIEVSSGREVGTFPRNNSFVDVISFSRDGRFGLFKNRDFSNKRIPFELWDTRLKERIVSWEMDEGKGFNRTCLSPDGRQAISAGIGGIKLWDTANGRELRTLTTDITHFAAYSPDGRFILTSGIYAPTLWEAATGKIVRSFMRRPLSNVNAVEFSPDDTQAIVSSGNAPHLLWDVANAKTVKIFKDHRTASFFGADGRRFLLTTEKAIELWDIGANKQLKTFQGSSVTFSSDNRLVAEKVANDRIKVWEFATGKEVRQYTERSGPVQHFWFSDNDRYLLTFLEKAAKRIDLATGREETYRWTEPIISGNDILFSPDGRYIAVRMLTEDVLKTKLKLYDVEARREVRSYEGIVPGAFCAFSPDGKRILFATRKNDLILSDIATGAVVRTFSGHTDMIWELGFTSRGDRIMTAGSGRDSTIRLWDTATGRAIVTFAGHAGGVRFTSLSHDGKRLLSVADDATIRLWDAATGKERAKFLGFTDGEWIVITPEGYFTASPNGAKYLNVSIGNKVYGIDQFYTKFYRPELVQLALAGKDLPKGETLGDILAKKPAPTVQILTPASGSSIDKDSITVSLRIIDNGGGIGNVMAYLNGSQVANETRGVIVKDKGPANEKTISFTIPLLEGQNEIRVIAFNQENSMESGPALVLVTSRALMQKPNLYALVIGINEYKNKSISLNYAVPDAKAFADTLKKMAAPLFEHTAVQVLTTPAETTQEAITRAFETLRPQVKPNDLFVFYNASHGLVDVVDEEEQYFLLTSNVLLLSSRHIGKAAISQKDLAKLIGNIPAQKKVVILDTCNAGKGGKEIQIALLQQTRGLTDSTAVKLLQRAIGSAVFSASSDTQLALEGYKGHGLFTYVLLEGLAGKADIKKDGYITVLGLADYVEENVVKLSEEVFKRQ